MPEIPTPEQPDEQDHRVRETLDNLYEALTEVQSHAEVNDQERERLLGEVDKLERDLLDQRAAAAKAGERDTYEHLSDELATLQRAYQALSDDPDENPLDEYVPTGQEPEDQPPTSQEDQP